jgi:tetratricopeptide (TPR) repeat protein
VREYFGEQVQHQRAEAWREGNRRLYEHYRALAPPLPENVRDLEPLLLAVTCGCQAGLLRDALHEVYVTRIQRGDASFAAKALGARGALLSVLAHFFEHGRWGSPAQTGVKGQSLTAEDQLLILMQAGTYLTATRGFSTPEARTCYERAEALCHALNRPLLLYSALTGQWRHCLLTDRLAATMQIAQRVYALARQQDSPALLVGAYRALAGTLYHLGEFNAARRHARCGVQLWRSGCVPAPVEEVHAPAVLCLCYEALAEWHFGEIASCRAAMAEAISVATELSDTHALALALFHAASLGQFDGDPAEVERLTADLIEVSTRQHFALWLTAAEILRGWARSTSGDAAGGLVCIEEGIRDYRAAGAMLYMPYVLALKAEALHRADRAAEALSTINEAETLIEKSGELWWSAELYRLRGVLLAALGTDELQIEAAFRAAIRLAKQQKSTSLERRAQAAFAEYCRRNAKAPDSTYD